MFNDKIQKQIDSCDYEISVLTANVLALKETMEILTRHLGLRIVPGKKKFIAGFAESLSRNSVKEEK